MATRSFSPDELFASIDDRMETTGFLARHAGRHVATPTADEAAEMLRRQPGRQGVLDYDGIRGPAFADENGVFQSAYKQRRARRSK